MAYSYNYINELKQYGFRQYTLVLEDATGVMPTIRNDKCFSLEDYPVMTDDIKDAEAQKDIEIYTQLYLDENPSEE